MKENHTHPKGSKRLIACCPGEQNEGNLENVAEIRYAPEERRLNRRRRSTKIPKDRGLLKEVVTISHCCFTMDKYSRHQNVESNENHENGRDLSKRRWPKRFAVSNALRRSRAGIGEEKVDRFVYLSWPNRWENRTARALAELCSATNRQ